MTDAVKQACHWQVTLVACDGKVDVSCNESNIRDLKILCLLMADWNPPVAPVAWQICPVMHMQHASGMWMPCMHALHNLVLTGYGVEKLHAPQHIAPIHIVNSSVKVEGDVLVAEPTILHCLAGTQLLAADKQVDL